MVFGPGQSSPPPASPYAAALSQALADCDDTTLNQVCYGGGSVTLDPGGPLTTPGQAATLDGVSGLTLVSPDVDHWSIALLRLAADSPTPDLGLTLLAFGNVEIRNLTLFEPAAGNGDVAPALSFISGPVPGEDPETGGLIVYNPSDEELLSISLNGADLTLGSSAVVQAQPGVKMTVTMATGGGLVGTAAGDGAVAQNYQLSVPIDENGNAAGAPTAPEPTDDDLLVPLVPEDGDLLVPLVPPERLPPDKVFDDYLSQFDSAYDHCMQGNSRQVYRVMYFARMLKQLEFVDPALMPVIDHETAQCATFELEFNSAITITSSLAWGDMYIKGQGMIVSYGMDGDLVQPAEMPLTHVRYNIDFALAPCIILTIEDGRLSHSEGSMRINRNRLDISTTVMPVDIWEHTIYTCMEDPMEMANPANWRTVFGQLHESEQVLTGYLFTPAHWKYTGNHILAEAIFGREIPFADGFATGDTWVVMIHSPGQ